MDMLERGKQGVQRLHQGEVRKEYTGSIRGR
jgi:hypothetical protein